MPQCLTCRQMFQAYDAIRPLPGAGALQMRWDYCRDCVIGHEWRVPDDEIPPGDPRRPINTGTGGWRIADIPPAGGGAGAGAVAPPLPPGPIFPRDAPLTFQPPKCPSGMECAICMEPMNNIDTLSVLNCGDIFHTGCISGHISSGYGGLTKNCPNCRTPILDALPVSLAYPTSADTHSPRSLESTRHLAKIQSAIDDIPTATAASDAAAARARAAALAMQAEAPPRTYSGHLVSGMPAFPTPLSAPIMGEVPWHPIRPGDRAAGWQPDTPQCQRCNAFFTVFFRRHHCRRCGFCICRNCSREIRLPTGEQVRVCTSLLCRPPP